MGELHFGEKLHGVLVVTVRVVSARQHASGEAVHRVHETLERSSDEAKVMQPHVGDRHVGESDGEPEHGQQHHGNGSQEHGHLQ